MINYNDSEYLREALDSVLQQSYDPMELVFVDDASTDDSWSILTEYAKRDSRLRLFRNERNQGVVFTSNRAYSLTRGEYLYFVSSNDKALPGFLEKAAAMLDAHPPAGLCWTDPSHFFENGGAVYSRRTGLTQGPAYFSPEDLARIYERGALSSPFHAAPALFRRSAYENAGGCIPELRWTCDFFLTMVAAFRGGMCYIPEALTSTRMLEKSYSRTVSAQKKTQRIVLTYMLDLLTSSRYSDIAPLVRRSGVLAYFGLPMFRLALGHPKYEHLLDRSFLHRGLLFSLKHQVRQISSLAFQRFYFQARDIIRSRMGRPWSGAPGGTQPSGTTP
jgi:glycosyltransferase involved in cell wall biosynthesis